MRHGPQAIFLAGVFGWASAGALAEDGVTRHSVAADTGLSTWEVDTRGVHLRLTQISPDQARAFMLGRGLDENSVEEFARTCVFMSVVRNDSKQPINYCLAEWRYAPKGKSAQLMLTKHDWLARWEPRKLAKPARLAFEWSQLPVEQTFAPGDWNQGMTTFELPSGSSFDVHYRWWQAGNIHEGILQNVQCPARAH
jgi:hypothetical protein